MGDILDTQSALQDEQAAVRGSAMVAVAQCVSALGPRCLPQLGPVLDTVLGGAEAALAQLPAEAAPSASAKKVRSIYLPCTCCCPLFIVTL